MDVDSVNGVWRRNKFSRNISFLPPLVWLDDDDYGRMLCDITAPNVRAGGRSAPLKWHTREYLSLSRWRARPHVFQDTAHLYGSSGRGKKKKKKAWPRIVDITSLPEESPDSQNINNSDKPTALLFIFLFLFLLFHDDENVLLATVRRSSIENYSVLPFSVDTYIRGCNYLRARSHIWHTTLVKLPPFFLSMAIRRYNLLFDGVPALRVFFISHANGHLKSVKHSLSSANAFWDLYGSV